MNKKTTSFEQTFKMSTYLVAWLVLIMSLSIVFLNYFINRAIVPDDWNYVENNTANGYPVNKSLIFGLPIYFQWST
jgi:hypothetical protein